MTHLHRVVIAWSGSSVKGAAVTVLHYSASDNSAPPVAALKAAFNAKSGLFPLNTAIVFPGSGDTIDDTTGDLVGVWTSPDGGQVTGSGSAQSAAGVGACIGWQTGGIVQGSKGTRKLRGRTFLVPLQTGVYDADGTFIQSWYNDLQTVANGIMASGPLAIWHRPSSATASDGTSYGVVSNKVRDHVAFLSSRRD